MPYSSKKIKSKLLLNPFTVNPRVISSNSNAPHSVIPELTRLCCVLPLRRRITPEIIRPNAVTAISGKCTHVLHV